MLTPTEHAAARKHREEGCGDPLLIEALAAWDALEDTTDA